MASVERQIDYVLRTVEERGVRLVRLWFTDVLGQLKSFAISPGRAGERVRGGHAVRRLGDRRVQPHPGERRAGPPRPEHVRAAAVVARSDATSARMFCDIANLDGTPVPGRPPPGAAPQPRPRARARATRSSSRRRWSSSTSRRATRAGRSRRWTPASYFDLTTADVSSDLRKRTIHTLEAMGIPVEYSFHEDARASTRSTCATPTRLSMADNVMTFRLVVREVATEQGVYATFMPKPIAGVQGSGMHTHLSLFEGDDQRVPRPVGDPYHLSKTGRALHRRPAAPRAGDHRGHQPVGELLQAAGRRLRGAGPRRLGPQPPVGAGPRPGDQGRQGLSASRFEYRSPDPACNPYLAFSVILAAGLRGHRRGLRAPGRGRRPTSSR